MANTYKILAQSYPAAATPTTLYTVPASTNTIVSTLIIANQAAANDTVRVSVAIGGAADASAQYIYGGNIANGMSISSLNSFAATMGITLAATDVIRVWSANGTCSFNLFGQEIT